MSQPDVEAVAIYDGARGASSRRGRGGPPRRPTGGRSRSQCRPCVLGGGRLRWVAPVTQRPAGAIGGGGRSFYEGPPPAASGGEVEGGWLMLDVTTAARTAAERQISTSGLLIAGVALALALVITLVIAQGLTSPLRALAQATREIGQGRWDAPLPRVASTEIAQLADDFRAMTVGARRSRPGEPALPRASRGDGGEPHARARGGLRAA